MKPRYAQELHTHSGIGSIGAGQRGFQIVGSTGDDQWGAGRGALNLRTSNISDDAAVEGPSLDSGSALRALARARDADTVTHAVLRSYEGSNQRTVPLHLQGDIRFRWRFGANFDPASEPWAAMITSEGAGGSGFAGSVMSCPTSNANLSTWEWEHANETYEVTGGVLVPTVPSPGFGSISGRFVGVGPGGISPNLFMVFKCNLGAYSPNSVAIDLGWEYQANDLVTWDLTYLQGANTATMKVWFQRLVTDQPSSVEFDVPADWLPWTAADAHNAVAIPGSDAGPQAGVVVLSAPTAIQYRNHLNNTWRTGGGDVQLILTSNPDHPETPPTISYRVEGSDPEVIGDTGPPNYTPILEQRYVGFLGRVYGPTGSAGTLNYGGPFGTGWFSPPLQPSSWPYSLLVLGGDPASVSTTPSASLGRQQDAPYTPSGEVLPHAMPEALADTGMYTNQTASGNYIEWAGFLMPRPTDEYGLGVAQPMGGPWTMSNVQMCALYYSFGGASIAPCYRTATITATPFDWGANGSSIVVTVTLDSPFAPPDGTHIYGPVHDGPYWDFWTTNQSPGSTGAGTWLNIASGQWSWTYTPSAPYTSEMASIGKVRVRYPTNVSGTTLGTQVWTPGRYVFTGNWG